MQERTGAFAERMQGRLCSLKSRFSDYRNDSSELPSLIGGFAAQPQAPAQLLDRATGMGIAQLTEQEGGQNTDG
jgi:hypothetical protein